MAPKRKKPRAESESANEEDRVLGEMLDDLNKRVAGSAHRLSDDGLSIHLPGVISTGSEWLDHAIGRGGIPLSRSILLSGAEGCGKTTLSLILCANVQRAGGIAVYIESEYKLDRDYASSLGVDVDRLILSQPGSLDGALDAIEDIVDVSRRSKSSRPMLIIVDSLNALPTIAELEGKDNPGASARVMSQGLRQITSKLSDQRVALVMVSQLREKIGVLWGKKTITGCGNAPRFYAAVILEMTPIKGLKEGGQKVGNVVKVVIAKNQIAAPFRKAEFILRFGAGVDWVHSLHEAAKVSGVTTTDPKQAGWVYWSTAPGGEKKWQGVAGLRKLLETSGDELIGDLITAVRAQYGWKEAPKPEHFSALLAAGAPFTSGATVEETPADEDDDEEDED